MPWSKDIHDEHMDTRQKVEAAKVICSMYDVLIDFGVKVVSTTTYVKVESDLGSVPLQPSNLPLLCPFGGFPLGGHHIFLEGALVGSYTPMVPGTTQWTPSNNFQGGTPKSEARATRASTKNPEYI